jgi:hypothetical protein
MGTSAQQQDRGAAADAEVRKHLAAGNARKARHAARHAIDAVMAEMYRTDPARAALLDASLAGSMTAQATALTGMQPRRPPGYAGGLPSAQQLLAAYAAARAETARQR